jgi:hypothetical protein
MSRTICRAHLLIFASIAFIMAIEGAHAERLKIFAEPNYGGRNRILAADEPALGGGGGFQIESVRVISGSWLLCTETNFGGDCLWLSQDVPSFASLGFDRKILSAKPKRIVITRFRWGGKAPPHRSIALFEKTNYEGRWRAISASTPLLPKDIQRLRPQSVVVQEGVWRLCSHPDYGGRCLTVAGDVWDLRAIFAVPIKSIDRVK